MTTLITDSDLEQRLKEQRRAWGADGYDEVWEGVTMMTPVRWANPRRAAARCLPANPSRCSSNSWPLSRAPRFT